MTDSLPTPEEAWAFNESRNKFCPKCGETNLADAVICWACYSALARIDDEAAYDRAANSRRQHERRARWEVHLHTGFDALPVVGVLLLIASGYAQKSRFPLLVSGLLALGACLVRSTRIERAQARAEEETPIQRITNTILLYAVRDGASQIRLRAGIDVHVSYLIDDEWQEQMELPAYVWKDLRAHLIEQSDNWTRFVAFQMNGHRFEFAGKFKRESELPLETVMLSLLD